MSGRATLQGTTVTSNPGKGALCIRTSDDQLTHLVWRDGSGQDQLDLIVFPQVDSMDTWLSSANGARACPTVVGSADTTKAAFVKELIDLSELIRDSGDLLSVSIPKNVIVEYRVDGSRPLLEGGVGQIRQIAMNLVTNAADAIGGESGGHITIETGIGRPEALGFSSASLSYGCVPPSPAFFRVVDNGEGMDQETLNRIFDPFFTTKVSGRGLGLAATLGIIQSHDASLSVESTEGKGTSFTVFFPSVEMKQGVRVKSEMTALPSEIFDRTALIVDDEGSVRMMLKKMLSTMNFEVLEGWKRCGRLVAFILSQYHVKTSSWC